jgi:hypothetical protein
LVEHLKIIYQGHHATTILIAIDSSKSEYKTSNTLLNRHFVKKYDMVNIFITYSWGKFHTFLVWWVLKELVILDKIYIQKGFSCGNILLTSPHLGFQIIWLTYHLSNASYMPGIFIDIGTQAWLN